MSVIDGKFKLNITVKVSGWNKLKFSDIGSRDTLTSSDIVPIEYKLTLSRWWQICDRDGVQRIASVDISETELTRLHLIVCIFGAMGKSGCGYGWYIVGSYDLNIDDMIITANSMHVVLDMLLLPSSQLLNLAVVNGISPRTIFGNMKTTVNTTVKWIMAFAYIR